MDNVIDTVAVSKLTKDLKKAAATLTDAEARYMVDYYYQLQADRIRSNNQVRQMVEPKEGEPVEPSELLAWLATNTGLLERRIASALDAYTGSRVVGQWARSITGIGPILAAGLMAHIDIKRAPTCGKIWRFAGLDPTVTWGKGERRPWNARLKTLCWKIGESFVKVSGNESDFYGKLYVARKAQEIERNEAGMFAEQAKASLSIKRYGADTIARKRYEEGKLPDARIHLRAKRYAVKIFLSHYHAVAYRDHFGVPAPKPYVLAHLGHVDEIQVPNYPFDK